MESCPPTPPPALRASVGKMRQGDLQRPHDREQIQELDKVKKELMWAPNRSIFRSDARKEWWEAGMRTEGFWANEQVTHHPQPHPSMFPCEVFLSLPRKTRNPSFAVSLPPPNHAKSPPSGARLAVSAAATLCSNNRNHFLPRQQHNSREQWFDLSCISELPGEPFKILSQLSQTL